MKNFHGRFSVNMRQADPQDWLWQSHDVHGVTWWVKSASKLRDPCFFLGVRLHRVLLLLCVWCGWRFQDVSLWKSVDRIMFFHFFVVSSVSVAFVETTCSFWHMDTFSLAERETAKRHFSGADADAPIYAGGLLEKILIEVCDCRSGNKQEQ